MDRTSVVAGEVAACLAGPLAEGEMRTAVEGKRNAAQADAARAVAAQGRVVGHGGSGNGSAKTKTPSLAERRFSIRFRQRSDVFGRPGSDLLSQALRLSTIGAKRFNGRVRDGIGFWASRNNHQIGEKHLSEFWLSRP